LQTRRHARWQRSLIPHLAPDRVCVQSPEHADYLKALGCSVALLPSGVDTDVYRPVTPARRRALRLQYGLDPDRPMALHVGHLKAERGVGVLAELVRTGVEQVVLVTSSSTVPEAALAAELRRAGVVVVTAYQPQIEHYYQMADCYVFPVTSAENAIDAPLSVLEALACDLPVVTTRFGGLPRMFGSRPHPGLVFADSMDTLVTQSVRLCRAGERGTRELVRDFGWETVAAQLLELALPREV
jgi:glycosyltransferase involved in cell wall biosynthesis